MMSSLLSREAFLKKRERRTLDVDVPELGGTVRVQEMTALERGRFESFLLDKNGQYKPDRIAKTRELMVLSTVVDAEGNRMFTHDDLPALSQLPAAALDRIVEAGRELAGITEEDFAKLVGNSKATATPD
jgi:hypothetical protein